MPIASVATKVVDLAALIEANLGVSSAWRERAEDHRRSAAKVAQARRDLVDLGDREADHRGPLRKTLDLARLLVAELREPPARDDARLGNQILEHRSDRVGAEQHRLLSTPGVKEPIREDVATLAIGAQLNLVYAEEVDASIHRHRLDRTDKVAG